MIKNIYTYLDEIQFEKRVKEEAAFIRRAKNSDNLDNIASDFVMLNFVYSLISDFFEKVAKDIKDEPQS